MLKRWNSKVYDVKLLLGTKIILQSMNIEEKIREIKEVETQRDLQSSISKLFKGDV